MPYKGKKSPRPRRPKGGSVPSPAVYNGSEFSYHREGALGPTIVDANNHFQQEILLPDIKIGSSNPQWKDQVLSGGNAATNYHIRRTAASPGLIDYQTDLSAIFGDGWRGGGSFRYMTAPQNLYPSDGVARDQAVAKLNSRISGLTQSYNVLTPLAEIRELRDTVHAMVDLTRSVVKTLVDLRKGRVGRGTKKAIREEVKRAQEIWLTYSFGISPMMADVNAIGSAISGFINNSHTDRVSSSAAGGSFHSSVGAFPGAFGSNVRCFTQEYHEVSYRFIAGWKFLVNCGNDYQNAKHFGVTPPSLITTAWELVPFSWVIDYFTTVGAFLEDTFLGQSGSAVYVVENRRYTVHATCSLVPYSANPAVLFEIGRSRQGQLIHTEFERTVLSALPPRVLRFKTLDEIGKGGLNKLLNLTALLRF